MPFTGNYFHSVILLSGRSLTTPPSLTWWWGGRLYVGGVDHLYQLTSDLQLEAQVSTGLTWIHLSASPHRALRLPSAHPLTTTTSCCCWRRGQRGRGQGASSTSPPMTRVSTVAVVITTDRKGRGPAADAGWSRLHQQRARDIPPITTRRLSRLSPPAGLLSGGGPGEAGGGELLLEYNNHFVAAVSHGDHVYFLFSRRHRKEYRSFVSRLCQSDRSFYSYVEVPLLCGGGHTWRRPPCWGSSQAPPPQAPPSSSGTGLHPRGNPAPRSAFGMAALDAMMLRAQEVCYTEGGGKRGEEAYIEYAVSSKCLKLPKYPCGGEHTPSPIASSLPLEATPTFTSDTQLTAVTTATEAGRTIAFLGDREGLLHKVLLHSNRSGLLYDSVLVDSGSPVSADLLLDESQQHVYVLTSRRLSKVPVSSCERLTDCETCLSVRDPYCGWCVLEGRCSRQHQCLRKMQPNHWLWSFEPTNQCVAVQNLQPANQSRDQQTQVTLSVLKLPALTGAESLSCVFGLLPPQPAIVSGTSITCQSPAPELLPPMLTESDHMILPVSVMFGHVTVTTGNMTFYDCGAVSRLHQNSMCVSCVHSVWSCSWCPLDQICTHNQSCSTHTIQRVRQLPVCLCAPSCPLVFSLPVSPPPVCLQAPSCPLVFSLQSSALFQYAVSQLQYSAAVYLRRGERRIDASPGLRLQLYDCSAGQSDCSQCRAVPPEYGCVWCSGSPAPSCVYNQSCSSVPADTCPPPKITQVVPVSGPLEGGVLVTITGSNLGMKYQDVVGGVTVAGVQCPPLPEGYQISTRIVCELQASGGPREGPVLVTVGTTPPGRSSQTFTYQVRGPPPCINAKLQSVSADLCNHVLMLSYRVLTSALCPQDPQLLALVPDRGPAERTVANASFRYLDDPVITDASPAESFYAGGRVVMVTGRNLGVVQQPIIAVWVEPVEGQRVKRRRRLALLSAKQQLVFNSSMTTVSEPCSVLSVSPEVKVKGVWFQLDNVRVHFETIKGQDLTRAISRQEVRAQLGDQECEVKTLDNTHLYCEPPESQGGGGGLPSLKVLTLQYTFIIQTIIPYYNNVPPLRC
ncbi:hypothetical protein F7725_006310 [Dissostichus mawsoni]|uniref:Sema domain-containing protein n=1 Tax=Dissostichus mawsoni TaxID=36200 RepID=A0A7J5XWF4_DISMA|nr:hypothetical protein F7725_006310 [Dissostichus mawsoni]